MPNHSSAQLTKGQFYSLGRFPGVIGAIDGTRIPIIAPSEDEHLFVNRKGFHSINVLTALQRPQVKHQFVQQSISKNVWLFYSPSC